MSYYTNLPVAELQSLIERTVAVLKRAVPYYAGVDDPERLAVEAARNIGQMDAIHKSLLTERNDALAAEAIARRAFDRVRECLGVYDKKTVVLASAVAKAITPAAPDTIKEPTP